MHKDENIVFVDRLSGDLIDYDEFETICEQTEEIIKSGINAIRRLQTKPAADSGNLAG